jgi:hypothetical protein
MSKEQVDHTALNHALSYDLPRVIEEGDVSNSVMLTGILGNALVKLIGLDGTFFANTGHTLYEIRLVVQSSLEMPLTTEPNSLLTLDTTPDTPENIAANIVSAAGATTDEYIPIEFFEAVERAITEAIHKERC